MAEDVNYEDGTKTMVFGHDQADWDTLAESGETFLIERAQLAWLTSCTELNATLERRRGLRRLDLELLAERAGLGHLLGLIVCNGIGR
jgi:hypothetical protein